MKFGRINGDYVLTGRYSDIRSPLFGKYYVDWHNRTGRSINDGVPDSFDTWADVISYLSKYDGKRL